MARVAAGSEAALRAIGERHFGRVLRLAQRMLGSAADADDVAQEVLVRVWQNARRWDPRRSRLSTWIYAIAYRLCVDRLRSRRTAALDEAGDVADPAPRAEELLIRRAEARRLNAAIAVLPPRQRAALALFYGEELSGPDAAQALGLRLRAFWSLLHRARAAVERMMAVDEQ